MYRQTNLMYIFTILECIEKCWIYTREFDNPSDFMWANDQKELNAVIGLFIAIGEESKKIEQILKDDIATQLNWNDIAGIRNKISHDYRGVDESILWNTITKDIYIVKNALIEMIRLINPDKPLIKKF